jgi:CheY-like chemotaxis protein
MTMYMLKRERLAVAEALRRGRPGPDRLAAGYFTGDMDRTEPPGAPCVLVAVTGHGRELDRQRCQEAGFDHHLAKPCEPEQLRALLASASNCGR